MDDRPLQIYVGYDAREAAAYHVFAQSIIDSVSHPVAFHPVGDLGLHRGSNAFTHSRFLVPALSGFQGFSLFADGDMVVTRDIAQLFALADPSKAVQLVKHDYRTKHRIKYRGSEMECPNVDYPRKNWSSLVLWNCAHPSNALLTKDYIAGASSTHLHRFQWLKDEQIGELPSSWNHLVEEDAPSSAELYHFTLGVPGIRYYADCKASWNWHATLLRALECAGEDPAAMSERALKRIGQAREPQHAVR